MKTQTTAAPKLAPFMARIAPDGNRGVQYLVAKRLDYVVVEIFADDSQAAEYAIKKELAVTTLADAAARIVDASK